MLINKDIKLNLMLSFVWMFNDYFYYKLFKYLSINNKNKDDTYIFFSLIIVMISVIIWVNK